VTRTRASRDLRVVVERHHTDYLDPVSGVPGADRQTPQERDFAAGGLDRHQFRCLFRVFERRVEPVDRVATAAQIGPDRVLDGGVVGVQRGDVVVAALGDQLEVALQVIVLSSALDMSGTLHGDA
jgi:hypothetical protein